MVLKYDTALTVLPSSWSNIMPSASLALHISYVTGRAGPASGAHVQLRSGRPGRSGDVDVPPL